jgi:hypothetical protein
MREVIRGHQRSSEAIEATRGHRDHQRPSEAIRDHQTS